MLKKKANSISEEELFASLSHYANGLPDKTVRDVYYSLIKVIVNQFRRGKDINLPKLGTFYVVEKKNIPLTNLNTGEKYRKNIRVITFTGCKAIKKYISSMDIRD